MDELIAFFNNLSSIFSDIVLQGEKLYPTCSFPQNPCMLVHSSLSAFGQVPGGAGTVALALHTLTKSSLKAGRCNGSEKNAKDESFSRPPMTLLFCAHSDSEPFDFRSTRCLKMGRIPEYIRTMPGTRRSKHPLLSFCAIGPKSKTFINKHRFAFGLGPHSPLGKLYKNDGLILMLGTSWDTCTALHLAEYKKPETETLTCSAAVIKHVGPFSRLKTHHALDIVFHSEKFPEIGKRFEKEYSNLVLTGNLPKGSWKLIRIRDLVDKCTFLR